MAITSGVGPHAAWLNVGGAQLPIEHGSVSQQATRKSSSFNVSVPLSFPGARGILASLGDNEATITVLARGASATLFTGEIDSTEFDYIARIIRVSGRDKSAKLHDMKTSEKWQNKKPDEIVRDLVGRAGLDAGNIEGSTLQAGKKLQQDFVRLADNVSFSYIIHKLAQFDGARWWVDAMGQFHYTKAGSPQGSYSVTINQDQEPISSDCMMLRIHRNVQAGKSIEVTVKAWHPKLKKVSQYVSNVEGNGGPIKFNYHIPTLEQDHVEKHAKSRADERARHEFTVHAVVVGDPSVSAGMGLSVNGTDFDQTFEIDAVHHEFGMSGYRTSITARSAKEGREAS